MCGDCSTAGPHPRGIAHGRNLSPCEIRTLGAPYPIDFVLYTPGGNDLIGSRVNLKEKLQLMCVPAAHLEM